MTFQSFEPAEVEEALGGRYKLEHKIAAGGQGAVYRATRTSGKDDASASENEVVALKLHFDPTEAFRVDREVTAMEHLSHPNLARLIEYGHCYVAGRKTRYIAYEFIEGLTLKQRLKSGGKLLESEVLPIGRDIAAAIAALWQHRIVHGDIKPSNIMLRESGGAVLIDLGVMRFFEANGASRPMRPVKQYSPSLVRNWGTMGYLSPEQAKGEKLTCASDIFSLAIVILECLHGWHPTNCDQTALVGGLLVSGRRLDISKGLMGLLDQMLTVSPRERGKLAKLSGYFEMLLQRAEQQFAQATPVAQRVEA